MQAAPAAARGHDKGAPLGCALLALDAHAPLDHETDWDVQPTYRPRASPAADGVIYKAKVSGRYCCCEKVMHPPPPWNIAP